MMTADATHVVNIRCIQCRTGDIVGYTVVVTADTYQLTLLKDKRQIHIITDEEAVGALLESLGRTLYAMRESSQHLKAFIEPMLVKNDNESNQVYAVRMVTAGDKVDEHHLLMSHYNRTEMVPSVFDSAKVALSHAGNIIDILSNERVDWNNIKLAKNYSSLK